MTDETPTDRYASLYESVETDPRREPHEIETGLVFTKVDDRMKVHSAYPTFMERLLAHPEFELSYYATTGEDGKRIVDAEEFEAEGHDGRKPVHLVAGTLPVGTLKISAEGRNRDTAGPIISKSVTEVEDDE